ncbi:MAG: 2-oxoacid:acceptor oxidoreductase subunit alpha [Candidatus Eremiobacterota bacterium]
MIEYHKNTGNPINSVNPCLSIVICGQAGQGIQTIEDILSRAAKNSGYNVFATKEYMSRIRGGFNSTEIRISEKPVKAYTDIIDILIPVGNDNLDHLEKKITEKTLIIGEKISTKHKFIEVPFVKIAAELGNKIYSNVIAAGMVAGILNIEEDLMFNYVTKYFSKYGEEIIEKNIEAVKKGYEIASTINIKISIEKNEAIKDHIIMTGTEAVALGAIAGGCNFISSYPMSPGTGVLTFLAKHYKDFGIIIDQAEDEIGAINMSAGAWCAGGRAMVTTSGGGFALMGEGLSLTGIMEIPMVIHIAQRPGPATGLPTRTVQGDLELALYSGHGDFPRIIFSPTGIEDAFYLTSRAFNMADKYQVPIFILTDQFLVDSYYNIDIDKLKFTCVNIENYFIETDSNYKRYKVTENGISPRGIFGHGSGLVSYDSHEHDEKGHITEEFDLTVKMQNKRMKKLKAITEDVIEPVLTGSEHYDILLIGWGSTCGVINEALSVINRNNIAFLSFSQVYPLHKKTEEYIKKAQKVIIIENNLTAQFSKLIKLNTGMEIKHKILKYNGLPFSVEEIVEQIRGII